MSESTPGRSETELATEAFVDSLMGIHPNLGREDLYGKIHGCVQDTVTDTEEESDGEEE